MTEVFKTYKSHKVVQATKISKVLSADGDGKTLFFIADDGTVVQAVVQAVVDRDFVTKHNPQAGGYMVQYSDGYESYSPAEAFEGGYDLVESEPVAPVEAAPAASAEVPEPIEPVADAAPAPVEAAPVEVSEADQPAQAAVETAPTEAPTI